MSTTPTPYTRQANFTSFATPDAPTVGLNIEAELNAVKTASDQTQSRLAELQRDDGALKNAIVTPDALSAAALQLVGGWTPRGAWVTITEYAYKDLITKDDVSYVCSVAHRAGDFDVDLANNKWLQLVTDGGSTIVAQDPLLFQDEGVDAAPAGDVVTVDFVGAGVTMTYSLGKVTVTIPGGSSNATTLNGQPDTFYRNASNLNAGTLPDARFPAALPTISGANVSNLNASALASGTVPDARFPATLPTASGANLTNLNATRLTTGTVAEALLPALARHQAMQVAVSDQTTALTTGTGKMTFRMPFSMSLTRVRASVNTASSSGVVTVDINKNGSSILSTKLTIDASEKTSFTAATPVVISDATLADDDEITIDIDTAGTGAKGLVVTLFGTESLSGA